MAKIPEEIVNKIIETAKIEEVVSDFMELRKTGVRYTGICPFHDDHEDGNFIVYPEGNCYRCFACEAKGGAVTFLMEHANMSFPDAIRYLGKKYNIETDNIPFDYVPPKPKPRPAPLPTLSLPRKMVADLSANTIGDTLVEWIRSLPWDDAARSRIDTALYEYCIGHATIHQYDKAHEFTVFWQVDSEGHPRTAHYMKYKPNGHRLHKEEEPYVTDWLHSILLRSGNSTLYDNTKNTARLCLFGEHLLKRYPNAPVCLVESEKTALLMAIAYGNHQLGVWLACCGLGNLTRDRLAPIIKQNRRIILYPDRDGIQKWKEAAAKINYDRLTIDTRAVMEWWKPDDGPKADIADVVTRIVKENAIANKNINDVPLAKKIIEQTLIELEQTE